MDVKPEKIQELHAGHWKSVIHQGELISLEYQGHQFMHPAEEPGWNHSDTEMFPIIGPTAETNYRVQVPKGNAVQDQHGLLRELHYEAVSISARKGVYRKEYKAGTLVKNSKYPDRSRIPQLIWPFSFRFTKTVELGANGLAVSFTIEGDQDMPYMLGYHPAFKIYGGENRVKGKDLDLGLTEILAAGDRALQVADCKELILTGKYPLKLETEGFSHFMLWSPDAGMLCIEPITYYPYSAGQSLLHEGFDHLGRDKVTYKLRLGLAR
ncbi:aldose epimerase family protein [Robiginitalea sp. IMCC44478]|uniref:aldose epimerase family protein n=1 Tax=Robiginitalea sp. IMCC44478 TaxID=3459122 RepID=UPI0040421D03